MFVGMIIMNCRSNIQIWMGGVLSRRLIFRFPKTKEYRGKLGQTICRRKSATKLESKVGLAFLQLLVHC